MDPQNLTGELTVTGTTQFDAPLTIGKGGELIDQATTPLAEPITISGGVMYVGQNLGSVWNLETNVNLTGGALIDNAGTLTVEDGTTVAGTGNLEGETLINQGTILANAGGSLNIGGGGVFENLGAISVSNGSKLVIGGTTIDNEGHTITVEGGSTLEVEGNWLSQFYNSGGTISAEGGSNIVIDVNNYNKERIAQLGTLRAADTSHIYLTGTFDIGGNTLDVSSWGPSGSTVLMGTLINGKVAGNSLGFAANTYGYYPSNPTVDNVEFLQAQNLGPGVTLNVIQGAQFDGGLTLNENSVLLYKTSGTLAGNVTFGPSGGYSYINVYSGTLTVAPSSTLEALGGGTIKGTALVNQGTIFANGTGTMYLQTGTLDNQGTIEVGGTQVIDSFSNFTQESTGVLSFILDSNTQYGQMDFHGMIVLNGSVDVSLLAGYVPKHDREWDIMNFAFGYTGSLTAPAGFTLIYNSNSILLEDTAAATPEPKSLLVLAAGGLCVFFKRRRRKAVTA